MKKLHVRALWRLLVMEHGCDDRSRSTGVRTRTVWFSCSRRKASKRRTCPWRFAMCTSRSMCLPHSSRSTSFTRSTRNIRRPAVALART
ncbi:unnamed protein product, partial [Symbiodinium microadriaticum]